MARKNPPKSPEPFGEDDPTVIDERQDTPVDPPTCPECGALADLDDFDERSLASFPPDRCKRAADSHWWVCVNYSKTHIKVVNYVPRR